MKWFPPEALRAAATVAGKPVGFGRAADVRKVATGLLAALGLPPTTLDPGKLVGAPWRPQETGVFNAAMAFRGTLDIAVQGLIQDLQWMTGATDWQQSAARFLFEDAPVPRPHCPSRRC